MGHLNRTAHDATRLVDFVHGQQRTVQLGNPVCRKVPRDVLDQSELDGIRGKGRRASDADNKRSYTWQ